MTKTNSSTLSSIAHFRVTSGALLLTLFLISCGGGGSTPTDNNPPPANNKTSRTLTFTGIPADGRITRNVGSDPFTITIAISAGTGDITYSSSDPAVATVNSATGEVTILTVGTTTITATLAVNDTYNEATASYTLTVRLPTPPIISATQSATAVHTLPLTEAIVIENTSARLADEGCQFVEAADSTTTTTNTAGLSIAVSGNNCHITGTPRRSDQATAGTPEVVMLFIRAFNADGSDWTTLALTINPAPPNLSDPSDSFELTLDTPIATITFANASDGIVASNGCDIGPALPTGLTIEPTSDRRSCQITGTPTRTLAATTYTVTASDGITPDLTPAQLTLAIRIPAMQVQTGESHSCLLNPTGEIWCWGYNGSGQLGTGDRLSRERPNRLGAETNWRSLTVGENHNCAINSSGELYCWGLGNSGQLGTANADSQNAPVQVGRQTDWVSVNADALHTCGIRDDGADRTLYCWGASGSRLGIGSTADQTTPAQVGSQQMDTLTGWLSVSTGTSHTCGIREDGATQLLYCWGAGGAGRLGTGNDSEQTAPAEVGTGNDWQRVSAGREHTCGIRGDGATNTLFCWGVGGSGQLGTGGTANELDPAQVGSGTDWQYIIAGREHTCGIRDDGTDQSLFCWGLGESGQLGTDGIANQTAPAQVGTQTNWRSVSLGRSHTCGIRGDGADQTLWCWGSGVSGRLGTGGNDNQNSPARVGTETNWLSVSAGSSHTCGIRADRTLWCWGSGANGRLGIVDSATNQPPVQQAIPAQVGTNTDWNSVSVGSLHTCGIREDGANRTLWCWGQGIFGQLGVDDSTDRNTPTLTNRDTSTNWHSVSASDSHTCGIRGNDTTRTLWCWGAGGSGRLGILNPANSNPFSTLLIPTQVGADTDWQNVSAGEQHICGIRTNQTLWCWGKGANGRLGYLYPSTSLPPSQQNTPSQVDEEGDADWQKVSAGDFHTCGIRGNDTNRTLWCWGSGNSGRLGLGDTDELFTPMQAGSQTDWHSVSAGQEHTCGIRDDGGDQTLWCWGEDSSGQLGVGNLITTLSPRQVANFTSASLLDSGRQHNCAITTTGSNNSLYCWGDVSDGRVGIGDVANFATTPQQTLFAIESLVTPTTLAEALDTTEILFNLLGTHSWMTQTEQTNDNTDAAAATTVAENDLTCITSPVSDAGTLSFYWRVSSEMDSDFLNFYINTIEVRSISGIVDWTPVNNVSIFANSELRWCYEKDGNGIIANDDNAFLDQVVFTPAPAPPPTSP